METEMGAGERGGKENCKGKTGCWKRKSRCWESRAVVGG